MSCTECPNWNLEVGCEHEPPAQVNVPETVLYCETHQSVWDGCKDAKEIGWVELNEPTE
jgi:hypothetical protein